MSVAATVACSACGEATPSAGRFCIHCGKPVQASCPSCGEAAPPGARFCMRCGAALNEAGTGTAAGAAQAGKPVPVAERRLVSVLFADLVGFTTLSEHRDPEEVRDLLSRYFDRCRTLVERFGGTVEKFIGDAVMAVWGTPVAREDDPERAVRAALALTAMVNGLGDEVGMADLRLRAGVLTGNAAVEVGVEGEGMVLGDTVNTASRLQSIAQPGTVLVDDVTRRASEAAIAYEDAGAHHVKGREQPVHGWTALRVVAGVGGGGRVVGLEAPFVGRSADLDRVVSAYEDAESSGRARLVAVVGEAGSGKSRLLWEYSKYTDGLQRVVRWHQGRCLSYGEGVGYWALAEMVRGRAGIVEEEDPATAREKLRATVEQYVRDERERRLVEPRLAHLLGLEQRHATDRADLFSGWRLFFERLSEDAPVSLAFEDLQWADSGLLDFIDYLLEWSADRPLFVLALGRPELLGARPGWAERTIHLGPLSDEAMHEALAGLVPGLPDELTARIVRQAEGVPLYAVETVRMLLDRGLLEQDGARYLLTGDVGELEVPETLHALAAARLDGLTSLERSVLQDAAVFGQSFTLGGVSAVAGHPADEVKRVLDGLVAKQVLGFNDDPLSAERGQYHFLQALLRTTAYGTLSRKDRKGRHLAVARHLQEAWGAEAPELAEVVAAHLLDAAGADPDAPDARQIRAMACDTLAEAGRRALSLALGAEAQRAFERGAELSDDPAARADLLAQAGDAALMAGDLESSRQRLQQAAAIFESLGDHLSASRSLGRLARVMFLADRLEEALDINRRAADGLPESSPEKARALVEMAVTLAFRGDYDEAMKLADAGLSIAEPLEEWMTILRGLKAVAVIRGKQGRLVEARALLHRVLEVALDHDIAEEALIGYNNLANHSLQLDRYADVLAIAEPGLALAKTRGHRLQEQMLVVMLASANVALGRWETLPEAEEGSLLARSGLPLLGYLPYAARVRAARGDVEGLRRILALAREQEDSANVEYASSPIVAGAIAMRALGESRKALEAALPLALGSEIANEDRREAIAEASLAALDLGDEATVERLIEFIEQRPPALRPPLLRAHAARFAGLLAAGRGDEKTADERLAAAGRELREVGAQFVLAQVLLEHAELLHGAGRDDEAMPLVAEAVEIFTRLGATPYLERARAVEVTVHA
jgi:class 3 adenylate cyclase/tetratricopeptide (TPR) repeat protein